jgi:hypothetical protein
VPGMAARIALRLAQMMHRGCHSRTGFISGRCADASGVARRAKAPGPTFVWSRLCWAPFALPAEFCNGLHTPPSPENAPQSRAFLQGPNVPDPGEWEQRPTGTPAVRMHGVHRRDFYMVVTAELIAASPAHPGNALCGRKSIS